MGRRPLEWIRDEDGSWQFPEGRRGEFVTLAVGLPFVALFAHTDTGLAHPLEYWPAVIVGACCGFLYATSYRGAIVERVPDWVSVGQLLSLLAGGAGLTILRIVRIAEPAVLFVLAAGGTILLVYAVRLCSPLHDGLEPPRRGVDPPPAVDTRATMRPEADASGDR